MWQSPGEDNVWSIVKSFARYGTISFINIFATFPLNPAPTHRYIFAPRSYTVPLSPVLMSSPAYVQSSQMIHFLQVYRPNVNAHFSFFPNALHILPISFSLILYPNTII